jgi:glyoxylase-like metal-dependent hydrolase (beta-lactamase superfamily II)
MIFTQLRVGSMGNFSYIIGDEETRQAFVVDPGFDIQKILQIVSGRKLQIKYIINTHEHFDHTSGNMDLASITGAKIVAHEKAQMQRNIPVKDGDIIRIGKTEIKVIHTPGHSPDSICLLLDKKLLTGDTLFIGECGRIDLPGGNIEDLFTSLFDKLLKLDDNTEVYPGHDYGEIPSSTIKFEKINNYILKPRTKAEFIKFMKEP